MDSFELPYMAQRRIQAKRMGRHFPPKEEAKKDDEEDDDGADSILFSIASDEDESEDGKEGGDAALIGPKGGGGVAASWSFSVTTIAAAPYPRPAPPPGPIDRLVRVVGVCVTPAWLNPASVTIPHNHDTHHHTHAQLSSVGMLAACLPCLPMGRVATLLSHGSGGAMEQPVGIRSDDDDGDHDEQQQQRRPYLNAAGWQACLLSALLGVGCCPVPCFWPALWPMRRAQRRAIEMRFPHYPSRTPTSTSNSSSSSSGSSSSSRSHRSSSPASWSWYPYLCFPCALAADQAFLEETATKPAAATATATPMTCKRNTRAERVGAASPPPFDPEEGWDLRPMVVEDGVVEDGEGEELGVTNK